MLLFIFWTFLHCNTKSSIRFYFCAMSRFCF
uniref:Uncharacterized protein n=1 Tax=Anguilla anguilla TaxID=7936 RepID=A0A0E9QMS6_ANGAN